jgi:hypothetical protein
MTTRERIDLLSRAYPGVFPRAELVRLVREQLGRVDAIERGTVRAPKSIYHVCAGNLAVSAWTSIGLGLIVGARNLVKLPGVREDSAARREIVEFIRGLPAALRRLVETHRTIDERRFSEAEVIVAFGSDATMESLRARTHWRQRFIGHGHAVSLLWLADPGRLTTREARAGAVDVLTYDQLGCLSPQAIYVPAGTDVGRLGGRLAVALEYEWRRIAKKPGRPLTVAARIGEARDLALACGHRLWLPPGKHLGWTVIHDPDPAFRPSPLHGVIFVREVAEGRLARALAPVAGRISTVGLAGKTSSRLREAFLSLGVSRFCEAGRMQFPPLTWHHDGRPALGDLVTWVDAEQAA